MSVALLINDAKSVSSLVPIATEVTYREVWQSGAKALALEWIAAMQGGVVVTEDNRAEILDELYKLRGWFGLNRVDLVVNALNGVHFDEGETAPLRGAIGTENA